MLTKTAPIRIKATSADEGTFEAIVSVFGNVDSVGDKVMPGAFTDTLAEWEAKGDPIPVLWSHLSYDPDYHIGVVEQAAELNAGDERLPDDLKANGGLWVKGQIDLDAPKAAQVYRLLKGRRVTQFSFAYDVLDAASVKADGEHVYELRKLKFYEIGPTLIGANQATDLLDVKGLSRALADAKAGRVLSSKNEGLLRGAYDGIGEVLNATRPMTERPRDRPTATTRTRTRASRRTLAGAPPRSVS